MRRRVQTPRCRATSAGAAFEVPMERRSGGSVLRLPTGRLDRDLILACAAGRGFVISVDGRPKLLLFLGGKQAFSFVHDRRGETLTLGAALTREKEHAILPLHGGREVRPRQTVGGPRQREHLGQL